MISKEHHKHPKLTRPKLGSFGRNEWAILGAPCGTIQKLANELITHLSDRYSCGYVDARHVAHDSHTVLPGMLNAGARAEYTDAIDHRQLLAATPWNIHQQRVVFNDCDIVLVNGNHHAATAQILIIDPAKTESVKRRLAQLTNVRLILLQDENTQVFDFLENTLSEISSIPRLMLQDTTGITRFFEQEMQKNIPEINGLVLAGGQSIRMGRDKGAIEWHGRPQRDYLAELLRPVCSEVYISCRPEQEAGFQDGLPTLPDSFLHLGPYGALLSAFRSKPDKAWLVVACDLPLLNRATIDFLIQERCVKNMATAFQSPSDGLPEPLITIWEPKAYPVLFSFLAQGFSCLRKVLINADAKILTVPDPDVLQNVNTPEDLEKMQNRPEFLP